MSNRYHLKANPLEQYFTKGQCLIDYKYMLDKTIKEIREKEPDKELHILEPSTGSKSLVVEYPNVVWHLYDLEPQSDDITKADFLSAQFGRRFDIICCNPPFKYKKEFAKKCMELSDNVIFISPPNCLPFYEYSIKKVYSIDFAVRCHIGLWHYDKSKQNQLKWTRKPTAIIEPRKITYEKYKLMTDEERERCVVLLAYIDYRAQRNLKNYELLPPSLIDTFETRENNIVEFTDWPFIDFTKEENWIRKSTNQFTKKGTYKTPYYVMLKPGKTFEQFKQYMNDNIQEFGHRTIGIDLVNSLCVLPLNKKEYLEWFELPEKN